MGFEQIINEEDLMKLLGTNKNRLNRLRREKGLPFISVGLGKRVYLDKDIIAWLEANSENNQGSLRR